MAGVVAAASLPVAALVEWVPALVEWVSALVEWVPALVEWVSVWPEVEVDMSLSEEVKEEEDPSDIITGCWKELSEWGVYREMASLMKPWRKKVQ